MESNPKTATFEGRKIKKPGSCRVKVPKKGLEPSRACAHYTLNVARLPIPPLGQL